jgi:hypothetical protein
MAVRDEGLVTRVASLPSISPGSAIDDTIEARDGTAERTRAGDDEAHNAFVDVIALVRIQPVALQAERSRQRPQLRGRTSDPRIRSVTARVNRPHRSPAASTSMSGRLPMLRP